MNNFLKLDEDTGRVHIGHTIRAYLEYMGLQYSTIADKINITRSGMYHIMSKSSIDTERLQTISEAVGHDFFAYYSRHNRIGMQSNEPMMTAEPEEPYRTVVLKMRGNKVVDQHTEEDTSDKQMRKEIESMRTEQAKIFHLLQEALPDIARKMATDPKANPGNIDAPKPNDGPE